MADNFGEVRVSCTCNQPPTQEMSFCISCGLECHKACMQDMICESCHAKNQNVNTKSTSSDSNDQNVNTKSTSPDSHDQSQKMEIDDHLSESSPKRPAYKVSNAENGNRDQEVSDEYTSASPPISPRRGRSSQPTSPRRSRRQVTLTDKGEKFYLSVKSRNERKRYTITRDKAPRHPDDSPDRETKPKLSLIHI